MAQVNPLTREVLVKLVYYGPGLGGKTTSLSHVHESAPAETRGELVSLATPVDRTLYFDFLPVRLEPVRGHRVRVQLFTVPGQVYFDATRKLVLTGADGVMFVADSQRARRDANVESLENLMANLGEHGRTLDDMPHALALNKRDLPEIMSEQELRADLDTRGAPVHPTVATEGTGVVEALDSLVRLVLEDLDRRGIFGAAGDPLPDVRLARADAVVLVHNPGQDRRAALPPFGVKPVFAARIVAEPASLPPGNLVAFATPRLSDPRPARASPACSRARPRTHAGSSMIFRPHVTARPSPAPRGSSAACSRTWCSRPASSRPTTSRWRCFSGWRATAGCRCASSSGERGTAGRSATATPSRPMRRPSSCACAPTGSSTGLLRSPGERGAGQG